MESTEPGLGSGLELLWSVTLTVGLMVTDPYAPDIHSRNRLQKSTS